MTQCTLRFIFRSQNVSETWGKAHFTSSVEEYLRASHIGVREIFSMEVI